MRHDVVIWSPKRATLAQFEAALGPSIKGSLLRTTAVITPLFHASPKYRQSTAEPEHLRLITLENGDYQQIHNPGHPNFAEMFDEWPRVIVHYRLMLHNMLEAGSEHRQAVLECHDLATNWEKAGWTSGTTLVNTEQGKDRHKILLGFLPWGWPDAHELEKTLESSAWALAKLLDGKWEYLDPDVKGSRDRLAKFFDNRGKIVEPAPDPMKDVRNIEDAEFGHI